MKVCKHLLLCKIVFNLAILFLVGISALFCYGQSNRLPTDIVPEHYNLLLKIDIYQRSPSNFNFGGTVDILIHCVKATRIIQLHALYLTIRRRDVRIIPLVNSPTPRIQSVREDRRKQVINIDLDRPLVRGGRYRLTVKFSSRLFRTPKFGLFYAPYQNRGRTE